MSVEIRPAAPEELLRALAPISHYFGSSGPPTEERMQGVVRVLPEGRMHAAFDGSAIVGGGGAFEFELTVPGGRVPAAGEICGGGGLGRESVGAGATIGRDTPPVTDQRTRTRPARAATTSTMLRKASPRELDPGT